MSAVFVSFATPDRAVAEEVVRALEGDDRDAWLCLREDDNPSGGNWAAGIAGALERAPAVVLLLSVHAIASGYVEREVAMAVGLKRPVLVVRLDDAPLSDGLRYHLSTVQFLDATDGSVGWMGTLRRALRRLIGDPVCLPLDSVADRDRKVRVLGALAERLDTGGSGVFHAYGCSIALAHHARADSAKVARWRRFAGAAAELFVWSPDHGYVRLPVRSREFLLLVPCIRAGGCENGGADGTCGEVLRRVERASLPDDVNLRWTGPRELAVFPGDMAEFLTGMRKGSDPGAGDFAGVAPPSASEARMVLEWAVGRAEETRKPSPFRLPRLFLREAALDWLRESVAESCTAYPVEREGDRL